MGCSWRQAQGVPPACRGSWRGGVGRAVARTEAGAAAPALHQAAQPEPHSPARILRGTVQSRSARSPIRAPGGAGSAGRGGRRPSPLRPCAQPIGAADRREVRPSPAPRSMRCGRALGAEAPPRSPGRTPGRRARTAAVACALP